MYTCKIYEKSEAKYNKEVAIYDANGKIVAICPLEEAEYIVTLKNQWETDKGRNSVVKKSLTTGGGEMTKRENYWQTPEGKIGLYSFYKQFNKEDEK
jgi:hypothetical protein